MFPELKIDYMKNVGMALVLGFALIVPGAIGLTITIGRSKFFGILSLVGQVLFVGGFAFGLLGLFIY
jgi:hypothetical protein